MPSSRALLAAGSAMAVAVAIMVAPASWASNGRASASAAADAAQLAWGSCADSELAAGGFQCASLAVPKDRSRPRGSTFTLALVRHVATGPPGERIGSLVFNPGGPGGSGLGAIAANWDALPEPVRARFDLVSWDPRGVGASGPALSDSCAEPWPVRPGTGKVNWASVTRRFIADLGRANRRCVARIGKDLQHIGTMEEVADLERIRAAIGDERLTFWGQSYGTRIGYVYALTYPDRVRAIVLDGSIDPASTTLSLTEGGAAPDQAFGSFAAAYPASAGRWEQVRGVLARRTVKLGAGVVLDRNVAADFVYGFIAQQASYPLIARTIDAWYAAIFDSGDARVAGRTFGGKVVSAIRKMPNTNAGGVFSLVNCLDYPQRPSTSQILREVRKQRRLAPAYGADLALMYGAGCSGIALKPDPIPVITGSGSPVSVLILGATRDGSTIVQWTARMSRAFPDSRTVTYAGGQHVTWAHAGSDCVNEVANNYVIAQALPPTDLACPNVVAVAQ